MRDSRKLFSSIEYLGRFSPALLVRFLQQHPDDFREYMESGVIPSDDRPDQLNLAELLPLLTRTGVSQTLADSLFLISTFATPRNRRILEEEVRSTKPSLNLMLPDALSDADYALSVWLARPFPSVLEAALSRVTLKSRRTFSYFTPGHPERAIDAPVVSSKMLDRLTSQLKGALKPTGCSRGVMVIPFLDSPDEDWFLIRRSRLPERITYLDESEKEVCISAMLRVYDVVVFDRVTGFLKINCCDKRHELFRQAFSDMYFRDLRFFVDKRIFTLEPLRSGSLDVVSCAGVDGISSVDLYSVCYNIDENFNSTRVDVSRKHWYATSARDTAPVPSSATDINYARFEVKFPGSKKPHQCRVDAGNTLSFSRDDAAKSFETFLRLRGYARGMDALVRNNAA